MRRRSFVRLLEAVFFISIGVSCSPEAKKARALDRAQQYFNQGEYDNAKVEYLNLLRIDHENAIAFEQLGRIWLEEGAPLRAGPFLLKARELRPDDIDNRLRLARAFNSVGQGAQAKEEAIQALEHNPTNVETILILADSARTKEDVDFVQQRLEKLPSLDTVSAQLAVATLSLRRGDLRSVENALQKAVQLDPRSPSAHQALAMFLLSRDNSTLALDELKQAADLVSARSPERVKYAEVKAQTGAIEEAKTMLHDITRQTPDYLPAWCLLAQIAYSQKKYDESLSLINNVLSRDAENIDGRRLEADALLAKGETTRAISNLQELDKSYPGVPLIKYHLARAYIANDNVTEAAVALNDCLSVTPDNVDAILLLGALDMRIGNPQVVVASMLGLLKKQPGLVPAQLLLGEAYEAAGRLDDAAALYRRQIEAWPSSAHPYNLLGAILLQQQKIEEARQMFEKALELAKDDLAPLEQPSGFGHCQQRLRPRD